MTLRDECPVECDLCFKLAVWAKVEMKLLLFFFLKRDGVEESDLDRQLQN